MATLANFDREPVQILVIGSDNGITNVIHSLHIHGFAEVKEWSLRMVAADACADSQKADANLDALRFDRISSEDKIIS